MRAASLTGWHRHALLHCHQQVSTPGPWKAGTALTPILRCAAIFEKQGVPLEGFGRPGETHLRATYESGVLFVLRFMVDTGVVRHFSKAARMVWLTEQSVLYSTELTHPAQASACSQVAIAALRWSLSPFISARHPCQPTRLLSQVGGNWVELPADKYIFHALGDSQKQSHCQMEAHVHYRHVMF